MQIENPYKESKRYIENAREDLKLAGKEENYYVDDKYVKSACGFAYSGILKALDFLFDIRKVQKQRGRKSIEFYHTVLGSMDKKLLKHLNNAYTILHLDGYYDGITYIPTIESGLELAKTIIDTLKPYSKNGEM